VRGNPKAAGPLLGGAVTQGINWHWIFSGIGISMALPTVPTAVLSAVAPQEMGKASGTNYMAQRLGGVFAIAISTAVFVANGHLGTPASVTDGFRPALAACAGFALLATLSATAITPRAGEPVPAPAT
jgi:hypothetical protein